MLDSLYQSDCPLWAEKFLDSMTFAFDEDVWVIAFAVFMSPEPPTNASLCKTFENWDWINVSAFQSKLARLMRPYWEIYLLFDDEGFSTGGEKVFQGFESPKMHEVVNMNDVDAMIAMWHRISHPHHVGIEKHWRKRYPKHAHRWDDVRNLLKLPNPHDGGLGRIFI